jgi:hypothetical protein
MLARVWQPGARKPERGQPGHGPRAAESVLITAVERGVDEGVFSVPDTYLATAALGAMGIRVAEWYRPNSELSIDAVIDAHALFSLRLLGAAGTS